MPELQFLNTEKEIKVKKNIKKFSAHFLALC